MPAEIVKNESGIKISGSIDFDCVSEVCELGNQLIKEYDKQIFRINFSALTYVDSSSLALLVAWLRYAKRLEKEIQFVQVPKSLIAIADVCGVRSLLPIEENI